MTQMAPNKQYNYPNGLAILSMLYMSIILCSIVVVRKKVLFFGIVASAASFVVPIAFSLGDIIAEVYGYKTSKKLIWNALVAQGVFSFFAAGLAHLPSPPGWEHQGAFNLIVEAFPRVFLSGLLAVPVSLLLNSFCISRWKVLLKGRFFWLRSIGASVIGEFIYTVICIYIIFYGHATELEIIEIASVSLLLKFSYSIVLAWPASIIVNLLYKYEKINVYDDNISYNPFKF